MRPSNTQFLFAATITAAIAICYGQVHAHLFLYDTVGFVLDNPYLREFSIANTKWLLTHAFLENWQPVTWLSHTLDFVLFGTEPGGHHLVNVALHLVNSLLLFYLLRLILIRVNSQTASMEIVAGVAAVVFAIHPQHVESVAMVAERKDVLYGLFSFLCCFAYIRYLDQAPGTRSRRRWYLMTLAIFAVDLMAKPMAVTLPVVLLALDLVLVPALAAAPLRLRLLVPHLLDKIPLLILSLLTVLVTLVTQQPAMAPWETMTFLHRVAHVIHNVAFYAEKFLLPLELSPYYPFEPLEAILRPAYWLPGLVLILAVTGFCGWMWLKGRRGFMVGWLVLLVTLAPVSGFFQVGTAAATDHYMYTVTIPMGLLVGRLAVATAGRLARFRAAVAAALGAYLLMYLALAHQQTSYWRTPFHLWSRTVALHPNAVLPRRNLVINYMLIGEYDAALAHLEYLPVEGQDLRAAIEEELAAQRPGN